MAQYTSQTRLRAILGTNVLSSIEGVTGLSLTTTIEAASDVVAGYLRNSGYTPPDTTDADASPPADMTVCLATEALVVRQLLQTPDMNLPLPEDWENSMQVVALSGILSGAVVLNLPRSAASSVGGFLGSDTTSATLDGGRPPRASREELAGY